MWFVSFLGSIFISLACLVGFVWFPSFFSFLGGHDKWINVYTEEERWERGARIVNWKKTRNDQRIRQSLFSIEFSENASALLFSLFGKCHEEGMRWNQGNLKNEWGRSTRGTVVLSAVEAIMRRSESKRARSTCFQKEKRVLPIDRNSCLCFSLVSSFDELCESSLRLWIKMCRFRVSIWSSIW